MAFGSKASVARYLKERVERERVKVERAKNELASVAIAQKVSLEGQQILDKISVVIAKVYQKDVCSACNGKGFIEEVIFEEKGFCPGYYQSRTPCGWCNNRGHWETSYEIVLSVSTLEEDAHVFVVATDMSGTGWAKIPCRDVVKVRDLWSGILSQVNQVFGPQYKVDLFRPPERREENQALRKCDMMGFDQILHALL